MKFYYKYLLKLVNLKIKIYFKKKDNLKSSFDFILLFIPV